MIRALITGRSLDPMGDKSPKNTDKKRKQQTKQAAKENKAAKKTTTP